MTAGVAVTTSPALKNHLSFSFAAVSGLMPVSHGSANVRDEL